MDYYAIDKSGELKHYKYIKKFRGRNGKWQYVYDKDKYDKGESKITKLTTKYRDSDRLLSREYSVTSLDGSYKTVVKERGKIDRAIDKGRSFLHSMPYEMQQTRVTNLTVKYENTDNLLSSKTTTDGSKYKTVTYKRGKIERAFNNGKEWLKARLSRGLDSVKVDTRHKPTVSRK